MEGQICYFISDLFLGIKIKKKGKGHFGMLFLSQTKERFFEEICKISTVNKARAL